MSARFHGIMSLTLVAVTVIIAALVLAQVTCGWAVGYLLLCVAGGSAILYACCAKCPCKTCCEHVLPGNLAGQFPRKPGPYSAIELAGVIIAGLLILGLPQLWLWRSLVAGIVFWVLNTIAFVQILLGVCSACANSHCPIGKMRAPHVGHQM
ncbi:MAG: hypothetical protein JXR84_07765 [Anaerolineae bacterium]|nr:hypothetical protein [Anaerolineae bacterium]